MKRIMKNAAGQYVILQGLDVMEPGSPDYVKTGTGFCDLGPAGRDSFETVSNSKLNPPDQFLKPLGNVPGLSDRRLIMLQNAYWVLDRVEKPAWKHWNDWIFSPNVKPRSPEIEDFDWRRPSFGEILNRHRIAKSDPEKFKAYVVGSHGGLSMFRPAPVKMPRGFIDFWTRLGEAVPDITPQNSEAKK